MFLDFTRRNLDSVGTNRAPHMRDRNVCQQFAAIGYSFIPHNIPNVRATGLASLLEWHTLVMTRAGASMYDVDLGLQSGICYADGMVLCSDECSLNVENATTEPTPTWSTVAQGWPDSEVNMIISLHRSTVFAKSVILTPWLHRIDGLQNLGKPSSSPVEMVMALGSSRYILTLSSVSFVYQQRQGNSIDQEQTDTTLRSGSRET